jgi:hypothetical protein
VIHEAFDPRTMPARGSWPPVRPEGPEFCEIWHCHDRSIRQCCECERPVCEEHTVMCEKCEDFVCSRCSGLIGELILCRRCQEETGEQVTS